MAMGRKNSLVIVRNFLKNQVGQLSAVTGRETVDLPPLTLENIMTSSCAKESVPQLVQWLQADRSNITHHEDRGTPACTFSETQVKHALDHLQFAYQEKVGVEDAILYLLNWTSPYRSHLDVFQSEQQYG